MGTQRQHSSKLPGGIAPIGCNAVPAIGTSEGTGHARKESGTDLGPPIHPCLHYAPKGRDSGSKGGRATLPRGMVTSSATAPPQAQSEPSPALIQIKPPSVILQSSVV